MDPITLLFMALGLSMDAFAVSIGNGILLGRATLKQSCKIAGAFGVFQGGMPIIGYLVASVFAKQIQRFDHWIAFGLLLLIGGKMLWDVFFEDEQETTRQCPTHWRTLLVMAVATSIDAMAVGVMMASNRTGLLVSGFGFLWCSAVIAVITFLTCFVGVKLGCKMGTAFGAKAQFVGGLVLIGIGIKILLEHLIEHGVL